MSELNPHESDLVLGGQNSPPTNAAILGGLAGIKQRLASESISERLSALNDAVQYGEHAIDLVLVALRHRAKEVRSLAETLLRDRLGDAGQRAFLDDVNIIRYFTMIENWKQKIYFNSNSEENRISDPKYTAYEIEINIGRWIYGGNPERALELMNRDPRISELQALIFKIRDCDYNFFDDKRKFESFRIAFDTLNSIHSSIENLKLLKLCEDKEDWNRDDDDEREYDYDEGTYSGPKYKYKNPHVYPVDLRPLLKLFPNLEYLSINGNFHNFFSSNNQELNDFRSDRASGSKLKTLIIDDENVNRTIYSLYPTDFPELEYFEIWFNDDENIVPTVKAIGSILSGKAAPKLKYLGLLNCQMADDLVKVLMQTPIIENLAVLDLRMGAMTDIGFRHILDCQKLGNLKFLYVSQNCISSNAFSGREQPNFEICMGTQYRSKEARDSSINRYTRSYE
jgi:hypothetical protein